MYAEKRKCLRCGKEFTGFTHKNAKYCSQDCYRNKKTVVDETDRWKSKYNELCNIHRESLKKDNIRLELLDVIYNSKVPLPCTVKWFDKPPTDRRRGVPHLMISDIHWDEIVYGEQIQYINEYNREIAIQSVKFTFEYFIKKYANYNFPGCVIALGGDLLTGIIRENERIASEVPISLSIRSLKSLLILCLEKVAEAFGRVYIVCVVGNHGRFSKDYKMKHQSYENFEWLLYHELNDHFRSKNDDRVIFDISDGRDIKWNVYGLKMQMVHGNQMRGGNGIAEHFSPMMHGLKKKFRKQQMINKPFDVLIMGHFHRLLFSNGLIANGSIIGYNEYADEFDFPPEPPQQIAFIAHPENGVVEPLNILSRAFDPNYKIINGNTTPFDSWDVKVSRELDRIPREVYNHLIMKSNER